jgi:hypothetical protein
MTSRWLTAGLLLTVAASAGLLVFLRWGQPRMSMGHEQPIAFSHRLHVTDKRIDCAYCHPLADLSINAGMPTVQKCLGCHASIIPGHPEIMKLKAYDTRGAHLDWVRVFYNPDHVYFPHYRHIGQGVECQECHGPVQAIDRLDTHTFYMGECLDCHDRRGASRECTACHQ